jgi:hypothetical protein
MSKKETSRDRALAQRRGRAYAERGKLVEPATRPPGQS